MQDAHAAGLGHEWATLQDNHEQYEKTSLLIKLVGIGLYVACVALSLDVVLTLALMLIMWVQEGIFRTSQSRLGDRIVRVEQLVRQGGVPYQLHTEWQAARPGFVGLIAEYARNMARPTVAFPYVLLILIETVSFLLY